MEELFIPEAARLLIIAPHPDDESIGCGGVLAKYHNQCKVLLLTNGCKGHKSNLTDIECAQTRHNEFISAMQSLNIEILSECGLPDGELAIHSKKIPEINLSAYDYIFVPHKNEAHRDHRAAYEYFDSLYQQKRCNAKMFGYEISRPIAVPTHYVEVNTCINIKKNLIKHYSSQMVMEDYIALAYGLNMYRGAAFKVGLAEAYEQIAGPGFLKAEVDNKQWKMKLKQFKKKLKKVLLHIYNVSSCKGKD